MEWSKESRTQCNKNDQTNQKNPKNITEESQQSQSSPLKKNVQSE